MSLGVLESKWRMPVSKSAALHMNINATLRACTTFSETNLFSPKGTIKVCPLVALVTIKLTKDGNALFEGDVWVFTDLCDRVLVDSMGVLKRY
ncbi:hypothetical protein Scep_022467 [Stephania cephalantha]|uniref:Uncharacterized protein n=1 Tax=Stephania cephalantha TaxID=152367 RepID=A0AAP0FF90_9MAGN